MMKNKVKRGTPIRLFLLLLLLTIIILLLIIIMLAVTTRGLYDLDMQFTQVKQSLGIEDSHGQPAEVCTSAECVKLSGEILSRMDTSVDPCDDFYEYACRGFINNPLIPEDSSKWASTSIMDKTNKYLVKEALESPLELDEPSEAIRKAQLFYKTCLNVTAESGQDLQSLYQLIEDLGSWPLKTPGSGWTEGTWSLEKAFAAAKMRYVNVLFMVYVSEDNRNNSVNRLIFNQARNFFPDSSFYEGPRAVAFKDAFSNLVISLVQLVGGDVNMVRSMVDDLWELDKAISQIKLTLIEYRSDVRKRYNLMTVTELQELTSDKLNISLYLDELYGRHISLSETVIVRVPKVFAKFGQVLENTKKSTLATYVVLLALRELGPAASSRIRDAALEFQKILAGGAVEQPQWQRCIAETVEALGFAVGALFTRGHFTAQDKEEIVELLENIRHAFLESIPMLTWMDEQTKTSAIDKAQRVSHKIGFPDFILNNKDLDEFYSDLDVTDDNLQNRIRACQRGSQRNLDKLGKHVDNEKWADHTSPTIVNAFYDPQKNSMIFPAGILQKPMYHSSYPRALTYGAIGTIMGHELTHGFDTTGRLYDKYGNLYNWWGNSSSQEFERKTKCLIEQYNSYELQGNQLDGVLTLGENIADNGGLRLSYRAYQSWQKNNRDKTLVGLDLTPNQMFFLGQAQTLCTAIKPAYIPHLVKNDVHSPGKYRVIGTMRNMEEFSETFKCSKNSPMNPKEKCVIWT